MTNAITKPVIAEAVANAVEKTMPAGAQATPIIKAVLADPVIKRATTPVSRLASETIQGITAAGVAQVLNLTGATKSLVIIAGWFGAVWNADDVSTVLTTVLTLAGLAWAWYGRETTTRPLA